MRYRRPDHSRLVTTIVPGRLVIGSVVSSGYLWICSGREALSRMAPSREAVNQLGAIRRAADETAAGQARERQVHSATAGDHAAMRSFGRAADMPSGKKSRTVHHEMRIGP